MYIVCSLNRSVILMHTSTYEWNSIEYRPKWNRLNTKNIPFSIIHLNKFKLRHEIDLSTAHTKIMENPLITHRELILCDVLLDIHAETLIFFLHFSFVQMFSMRLSSMRWDFFKTKFYCIYWIWYGLMQMNVCWHFIWLVPIN